MPNRVKIEAGQRFGRLRVLSEAERAAPDARGFRAFQALVQCDCGTEFVVKYGSLRSGNTQSCGCLQREMASSSTARVSHGHARSGAFSGAYRTWRSMIV